MLPEFLETNQITAQILTFDEEVKNCKQAMALEKTNPIVKSILFTHEKGFVLVILEGTQKTDLKALETLLQTQHARLATPEEVENVTGYEVGAVPPISIYGVPTLIDEGVLKHVWVVCGGGDKFSLLKIQSKDILVHAWEAKVVKVAK